MYDRKTAARPFDTIYDTLRSLSLVQCLLKDQNPPIWRQRAPTHMTLSRTDRLSYRNVSNESESQGSDESSLKDLIHEGLNPSLGSQKFLPHLFTNIKGDYF